MRACETRAENGSFVKRVTVRTGGPGYAHSGVIKASDATTCATGDAVSDGHAAVLRSANNLVVRLGS